MYLIYYDHKYDLEVGIHLEDLVIEVKLGESELTLVGRPVLEGAVVDPEVVVAVGLHDGVGHLDPPPAAAGEDEVLALRVGLGEAVPLAGTEVEL